MTRLLYPACSAWSFFRWLTCSAAAAAHRHHPRWPKPTSDLAARRRRRTRRRCRRRGSRAARARTRSRRWVAGSCLQQCGRRTEAINRWIAPGAEHKSRHSVACRNSSNVHTSDGRAALAAVEDDGARVLVDHGAAVRAPPEPRLHLLVLHDERRCRRPACGLAARRGQEFVSGSDITSWHHDDAEPIERRT